MRLRRRRLPCRRSPSRSTSRACTTRSTRRSRRACRCSSCGPIAPGPYCDPVFADTYDPEGAAAVLTEAGWTKNADGMWAKDGEVPEIHWMVNTGNTRRESTQEFLIPKLAEAGFNVIADNCEATAVRVPDPPAGARLRPGDVHQHRRTGPGVPDGSFGLRPDPDRGEQLPGSEHTGWCNEEATDCSHRGRRRRSTRRSASTLVKEAIAMMADGSRDAADAAVPERRRLPHRQGRRARRTTSPTTGRSTTGRTSRIVDGDGQVVIGAEQFPTPDCPNPITAVRQLVVVLVGRGRSRSSSARTTPTNDQTFDAHRDDRRRGRGHQRRRLIASADVSALLT